MDWYEIAAIVWAVIGLLGTVAWGVLFNRGRKLWAGLQELKDDYKKAVADGKITDTEKAEIADNIIDIIEHTTSIWQVLQNLIFDVSGVIRKTK